MKEGRRQGGGNEEKAEGMKEGRIQGEGGAEKSESGRDEGRKTGSRK